MNQIYPKNSEPNYHLNRKWHVSYKHLVYDNCVDSWVKGYHTYIGARVAAFYHYYIASWGGGSVYLYRKEKK